MDTIIHEGQFFLFSIFSGILLLFAYDFFRILRAIIPHKKWVIFIQDYLFWLISGFFVFIMVYQLNSGAIRGFCIMGILLGMWGYHYGPSSFVVWIVSAIPKRCIRILRKRGKHRKATGFLIEKKTRRSYNENKLYKKGR